jgi:hypothetical protein
MTPEYRLQCVQTATAKVTEIYDNGTVEARIDAYILDLAEDDPATLREVLTAIEAAGWTYVEWVATEGYGGCVMEVRLTRPANAVELLLIQERKAARAAEQEAYDRKQWEKLKGRFGESS